jgi:hypothetical protein
MNTATLLTCLEALQQELNAIEVQMTHPNADQNVLDDAWEEITREMDELSTLIWNNVEDTRDPHMPAETGYCGYPCDYGCPTCSEQYDPRDEL